MRIYSAEDLETLHALRLIKHWKHDDLLTEEQAAKLTRQNSSGLRTTNLFLRLVLFFFTIVILGGVTALIFLLFMENAGPNGMVLPMLIIAVACYAAAEYAVREARFYHFGVEEALVVYAIGSFFAALFGAHDNFREGTDLAALAILIACATFALWTWLRFGYWYTFVIAMLFTAAVPWCLTRSLAAQHTLVAVLYAAGLLAVTTINARPHSDDQRSLYTTAEAFLWTGLYLSVNLVLSSVHPRLLYAYTPDPSDVPRPFYWFTFLLIWLLPPAILARGIRRKDRAILVLGACLFIVTLICIKPSLGWQRHPWDPMLLGIVLAAAAWYLQRWLASAPNGIRNGFTAKRLAGKQSTWMNTAPSTLGLFVPHTVHATPANIDKPLGQGGESGGAGAGGSF